MLAAIRSTLFATATVLFVLTAGCMAPTDDDADDDELMDDEVSSALVDGDDAIESAVIDAINRERRALGLGPLSAQRCVDRYAEKWVVHLANTGTLSHQSMSALASGCKTGWASETINRGVGLTAEGAVASWMGSAGHRAILTSPSPNRIGVGVKTLPDGGRYFVADFIRK